MYKPRTKKELLDTSHAQFNALCKIIEHLPAKERIKPWKTKSRDQNLRDLIYHLYAWHKLLINWISILEEGGKPVIPKMGYTWDDLDTLNYDLWLEAKHLPFMEVYECFIESYQACTKIVNTLDDERIFTPYYKMYNHPLISLIDGCMREHYLWAINEIQKHD